MTIELDIEKGAKLDDMALATRAGEMLNKHYPGWLWAVNVNSEGGVMDIKNLQISSKYGFRLFLSQVYQDPNLKCVMRAGGEFLERVNKPRGMNRGDQVIHIEGAKKQYQPTPGGIIV